MLGDAFGYERVCPAGSVITGMKIRSGSYVNAIGPFDCASAASALPAVGGSGGSAVSRDASAGGYTAVRLQSGGFVNSIALTRANGTFQRQYGGAGGATGATLACPAGTRIAGFYGRQIQEYPVTVGLVCRAVSKRVSGVLALLWHGHATVWPSAPCSL